MNPNTSINTDTFILEYLKDFNPGIAILIAGYKGPDHEMAGMRLLLEPGIQNEILRIIEAKAQALTSSVPAILRKLWLIASADVAELVQVTQGCCRHCWGAGHGYQRTPWEYRQHMKKSEDPEGGPGYDLRKPPNPHCPECFGEGETRTRYTPTAQLSPAAKALMAGVRHTAHGPVIKTHNQVEAMKTLVRHQHHWLKPGSRGTFETDPNFTRCLEIAGQIRDGRFDPQAVPSRQDEREEYARKHPPQIIPEDDGPPKIDWDDIPLPQPGTPDYFGLRARAEARASAAAIASPPAGGEGHSPAAGVAVVTPGPAEESCLMRAEHVDASSPHGGTAGRGNALEQSVVDPHRQFPDNRGFSGYCDDLPASFPVRTALARANSAQ